MKKVFNNRIQWEDDKGYLHRLDGPAVEYDNGYKYWYQNGKFHRLDGPAIERSNGHKEWWLNGFKHTEQEWFNLLTEDEKLDYILKGER